MLQGWGPSMAMGAPQSHLDTQEQPRLNQGKPKGEGRLKEEDILVHYKLLFYMHLSCMTHK